MAGTYNAFKTDPARETNGIVLDLGSSGKFRLARAGGANSAFAKRLAVLSKPHRRAIQAEVIDPKVAEEMMSRVYAETVLLGWEGVTGEDGEPLPFSKENAFRLLSDLPDLRQEIVEASTNMHYFRVDLMETDAKNS